MILPRSLACLLGTGSPDMPDALHRHRGARKRLRLDCPLEEAEFVVFDTELTGLSYGRDSIVSIGAIKMRGGAILPATEFYRLVRPESELRGESVCIHEITPDELAASAVEPVCALVEFIDYAGDAVLVGHFVEIDVTFVSRAMRRHFCMPLQSRAVDTAILHSWMVERGSGLSRHYGGMCREQDLFIMARHYGIEPGGRAHNALLDAFVTAQLFQRLLAFLPESGIKTVGGLLRAGGL